MREYLSPEYEMFFDDSRYECKVKLLSFVDDSFCATAIGSPFGLVAFKSQHFMLTDQDLRDFKDWTEKSCKGYITGFTWRKFFETRGYKVGSYSLLQEFRKHCHTAWYI